MSDDEALIGKAEAARLMAVSVRTIEGWVAIRRVPFVRLGGGERPTIRFRPSALRAWVAAQEIQTTHKTKPPLTVLVYPSSSVDPDGQGRYIARIFTDLALQPVAVVIATADPTAGEPITIKSVEQGGLPLSEAKKQEWEGLAKKAIEDFCTHRNTDQG